MNSILIRNSRAYAAVGIVFGIVFFMLGCALTLRQDGIYAICFFLLAGGLIAVGIHLIRDREPRINMNREGILIKKCLDTRIPWSCIHSVDLKVMPRGTRFLSFVLLSSCIDVSQINKFRCSIKHEKDGSTRMSVSVEGTDMKAEEIVRLIKAQISSTT